MKKHGPRDRSANKPGRNMRNNAGGMSARHKVNPAGSKIARMAKEHRITTHTIFVSNR